MKKLFRKLAAAAALSSMLLQVFASIALAETIEISGNGADSENDAMVNTTKQTTVVQNNTAEIFNDIEAEAETGENEANDNTGGDTLIMTGNATTSVDVATRVNLNAIEDRVETQRDDTSILISGNGADSDNDVDLNSLEETEIFQDNFAYIENDIEAEAETGENEANRNTGGETAVITGHATTEVEVSNVANANLVDLRGPTNGTVPTYDIRIVGNGANSRTNVDVNRQKFLTIVQDNFADIFNYVEVEAETGENEANDNTGGDVMIDTGMAQASATVENWANLNVATTNGWLPEVLAKIYGNGALSRNDVDVCFLDEVAVFQGDDGESGNVLFLENDVDNEPESGDNEANRNTYGEGDPLVITGHALSDVLVRNTANANYYGTRPAMDWFDNFELNFSFNLGGLVGRLLR
ncbi:MAG: hypothetical protein ACOX6V_01255 [Patescibacteria group bacterium]